MSMGKRLTVAERDRVLELRAAEPELTLPQLAERSGLARNTVWAIVKGTAVIGHVKGDITVGDRVRITRRGQTHKRTAIVVEVPAFPFRDHRLLRFDATPTDAGGWERMVPLEDMSFVEHTGQLALLEASP